MNSNLILTNSSQFNIADEEVLLRSIPSKIKIGDLSTDALRLLVYYVAKAGPFELAVDSGYFEGTLEEWLHSMKSNLQFKASVESYSDLADLEGLVAGDVVFVRFTSLAYIYDGEAFAAEPEGISISGPSAYDLAVQNGFVGTVTEWLDSLKGEDGDEGEQGLKGDKGDKGDTGLSAYELATADVVDAPTLEEWLLSLKGDNGADGLKGDNGENGADGKSAFEVAVANGFEGTELEWLASLKGDPGINGQSAYDLAVESGFEGSLEDWLVSLVGAKGEDGADGTSGTDGQDGQSAYELAVALGFEGDEATWILSLKGDKGEPGEKGDTFTFEDLTPEQVLSLKGEPGADGEKGDAFTFADFTPEQLEGLKGPKGEDGADGKAFTYEDFTPTQLEGLKGPKGDQGEQGPAGQDGVDGTNGTNGKSAYELAVELGFVGDEAAWLLSLKGQDGQDAPAVDVTSTTLTGYIEGTNETVVETDTLLQAIAKLQAQNDALAARILALESA